MAWQQPWQTFVRASFPFQWPSLDLPTMPLSKWLAGPGCPASSLCPPCLRLVRWLVSPAWSPWQYAVRTRLPCVQCPCSGDLETLVAAVAIFRAHPFPPVYDASVPEAVPRIKWSGGPGGNRSNLLCAPSPPLPVHNPWFQEARWNVHSSGLAAMSCASSRPPSLPRPSGRDRRDNLAGRTRQLLEAEQQTLAR